jgi:hypothetical protein
MRSPTRIKPGLKAITAAALLTPLGLWLLLYAWPQRHLYYQDYRFDKSEARRLAAYPQAMLAYGDRAWQDLATDQAAFFYRRAVSRDVLAMDAWLKLARTEADRGQTEKAQAILAFVIAIAGNTSRWQSSIALLAHELGMADNFRRSINLLVERALNVDAALTLLDEHGGGAAESLALLDPAHQPAYLLWLMRWDRLADARLIWEHLSAHQTPDPSIILKYVDFLILNKAIGEAQAIWQAHTGTIGITNGGFDHFPSGKGFDWRAYPSQEKHWELQQAAGEGHAQSAGLKIIFSGRANVDFHHLYQIVPLPPGRDYRLTYRWRGLRLSSDQGPFIDLEGYDCNDFYVHGPMMLGSAAWREERIKFTTPSDCEAIRVRLRRRTSSRFDNRIEGTLWLDDFRIAPHQLQAGDK